MAKYYFDIIDGEEHVDSEGVELMDLTTARIEAVRVAAEVLKEMPERFWHSELWTLTVYDESRVKLFALKFIAESA